MVNGSTEVPQMNADSADGAANGDLPTISDIRVGGPRDAWETLGFALDGDVIGLANATLFVGPTPATSDSNAAWRAVTGPSGEGARHPNGVTAIDHLVIRTSDIDATAERLVGDGLSYRRTRRVDDVGMEQRFFLGANLVVEVVTATNEAAIPGVIDHLWGVAFVSDDIEETAQRLSSACSPIRSAVQPGRRIATIRTEGTGIDVHLAVMSPRRKRSEPNHA